MELGRDAIEHNLATPLVTVWMFAQILQSTIILFIERQRFLIAIAKLSLTVMNASR
jgi:hypothetical protein